MGNPLMKPDTLIQITNLIQNVDNLLKMNTQLINQINANHTISNVEGIQKNFSLIKQLHSNLQEVRAFERYFVVISHHNNAHIFLSPKDTRIV